MSEENLNKIRTYLIEALLNRGKAIPNNVSMPGLRGIHMLNFVDDKIKDAIGVLDKMIQSSASTVREEKNE